MDLSGLSSVTNASQLTEWLAANMVTPVSPAISGSDMGTILQKVVSILGSAGGPGLVAFTVESGSYTIALTDTAIDMNVASANTVTIPANATTAFPIGTQILLTQSGAGQTVVAGATGVTINSVAGNTALAAQYSWATLVKRATDTWWLYGDLTAAPTPPPPIAVKINLIGGSIDATSSGWNNNMDVNFIGTSQSLNTTSGTSSGWTAVASASGAADFKSNTEFVFGNADFPDDVLNLAWTVASGDYISITVSGLTANQTCTVKTATAYYTSGAGATKVTVGGQSQEPGTPDASVVEFSFDANADSSGNLVIRFEGIPGTTYPLLNGIIISTN